LNRSAVIASAKGAWQSRSGGHQQVLLWIATALRASR